MLHLDLAVLMSFSISLAFFSAGNVDASVPLAYPPLLYLLARLLCTPLARPRPPARAAADPPAHPPSCSAPRSLFLVGFRPRAAGGQLERDRRRLCGGDRRRSAPAHGEAIYGNFPDDNPRGDTYGPLVYFAYLPFELLFPWSGTWDDLPAAHVASARPSTSRARCRPVPRRPPTLPQLHGLLLAYLWLAFPFTLFAANSGSNDALTGILVLAAVPHPRRARWRPPPPH